MKFNDQYYRRPNTGFLSDDNMRIVITAPDKDLLLQEDDIAFMLIQYEEEEEEEAMTSNSK